MYLLVHFIFQSLHFIEMIIHLFHFGVTYGGRKGPSHPSLMDALPYFHRHFHTSIGASSTTFAHAQSANVRQASTNTHEVKSWMASNRQGPIVAAATRDGLIRHYFFEGFEYRLIACFLYFVHGINISVRQIKRVLRVFNLRRKSRWNSSSIRTIRNLVLVCLIYPHVSMRDMSDCCAGRVEDFRKHARVQDDV